MRCEDVGAHWKRDRINVVGTKGDTAMRLANLIALVGLIVGLTGAPLAAQAAGCTNASLKGGFGFASTVVQNNNVPPIFAELVGLMRFDGLGNANTSFTQSTSDGNVSGPIVASWIYTVAADCTFTVAQDNGESFAGVIVLDGQQFFIIETSGACCGTALVRRGQAVRIHTRD